MEQGMSKKLSLGIFAFILAAVLSVMCVGCSSESDTSSDDSATEPGLEEPSDNEDVLAPEPEEPSDSDAPTRE